MANGERWDLLGDAEFLLIFDERTPLPSLLDLDQLCRCTEEDLLRRNLRCHISLSAVHPGYLRKLQPHIFAYELRACGQVAWGDAEVLSLIPTFSAADIPLEDAWRLLCNRMIEQLEVAAELADRPAILSQGAYYRTVKLYLDMATSYLVFAGGYEPSYRGRAERLKALAENAPPTTQAPFPLREFAERVMACTQAKLLGSVQSAPTNTSQEREAGTGFWESAAVYARLLWRWELARLTGADAQLPDRVLLERWMRLQPVFKRLRGWLYVLRQGGWHRSWRHWPHWVRCARHASPRYWVYATASELFFRLPLLLVGDGQKADPTYDWHELRSKLPMAWEGSLPSGRSAWQQLAADIVRNYHEFLERTRA